MQKKLKIESNSNWPEISLDADTGRLEITGRSILENTVKFYDPVVDWMVEYCTCPAETTELHLKLEYFNTSTSKYLLTLISLLEEIYNEGKEVKIYWYSADEDMAELGEDYNAIIDIPFKFLEYSE